VEKRGDLVLNERGELSPPLADESEKADFVSRFYDAGFVETNYFPYQSLRPRRRGDGRWIMEPGSSYMLAQTVANVLQYLTAPEAERPAAPKHVYGRSAHRIVVKHKSGGVYVDSTDPLSRFLQVVKGDDTAQRMSRCEICQRFFFKIRIDKPACSSPCANALRVRKWRKNKDKYEYARYRRLEGGQK
jgi:hypothetical protein